jgi:hypothetical protein
MSKQADERLDVNDLCLEDQCILEVIEEEIIRMAATGENEAEVVIINVPRNKVLAKMKQRMQ